MRATSSLCLPACGARRSDRLHDAPLTLDFQKQLRRRFDEPEEDVERFIVFIPQPGLDMKLAPCVLTAVDAPMKTLDGSSFLCQPYGWKRPTRRAPYRLQSTPISLSSSPARPQWEGLKKPKDLACAGRVE